MLARAVYLTGLGRFRPQRTKPSYLGLLGMILVIASLLLGMSLRAFGEEKGPIRIGATVSLEGKYQEPSLMIRDALKLWETQINQRGGLLGRPVQLILYDDRSKADLVRKFYEKLITEDRVNLVFSPYSSELTLVASEVSERHKVIMMASTASAESIWQRGYKYIFGIYAPAKRYLIGFLDLMARHGLESVAIFSEKSPFNLAAAQGAEEWAARFGIKVTFLKSYQQGPAELPQLLQEARRTSPDAIILCAYPRDCYKFLDLLQATESRHKALCMTIGPALPTFYEQAGSKAEGVFGPSQWEPDARMPFPGTKEFLESYKKLNHRAPSYHAGSVYAACQILERAISQTKSLDREKIRDYILSLDTVTVIGRFRVDHTGMQIGHNPILIQWQNGKKEIVYPTNLQTAPARF